MFSFLNLISGLNQLDLTILGTLFTALYKVNFLYFLITNIWDGSVIEKFLTPINSSGINWRQFFPFNGVENCEDFFSVHIKQRCIRDVFVKDLADVQSFADNLKNLSKTYYLIIATTAHRLAPFIYQLSLFLIPVLGFLLLSNTLRRFKHYLGYTPSRPISSGHLFLKIVIDGKKVKNFICISGGVLTTALMVCLASTHSFRDVNTTCETPSCLYCIPRLQQTIFKDQDDEDYYNPFGKSTRFYLSFAKFVSAIIFSFILYGLTTLVVSFNAFVVIDTAWSWFLSCNAVYDYVSKISPRAVDSLWKGTKYAFQGPGTRFRLSPKVKDTVNRLSPKVKDTINRLSPRNVAVYRQSSAKDAEIRESPKRDGVLSFKNVAEQVLID